MHEPLTQSDIFPSCLVQVFIKFHIGYKDRKGRIVSDFKSVALHYLKAPLGFTVDVITILPVEVFALAITDPGTRTTVLLYSRVLHVGRIVRIWGFFVAEEKKLNQQ